MSSPNVQFRIGATDTTKKTFDNLESRLKGIQSATSNLFKFELLKKGVEIINRTLQEAAKVDDGVKKQMTQMGDLYRGFQVEVANVVVQNKDFIESMLRVGKDIAPLVLGALAGVIVTIKKLADIVQVAINGFKMIGRVLRGESIDDLVSQNSQLASNILTVEDYTKAFSQVPNAIKPVTEEVNRNTDALKKQRQELLTVDQMVARMTLEANSPRRRNEDTAKAVFEANQEAEKKNAEQMARLNDRITRGIYDATPQALGTLPPIVIGNLPDLQIPLVERMRVAVQAQAGEMQEMFNQEFGTVFQQSFIDIFQNGSIDDVFQNFIDNVKASLQKGMAVMTAEWVKGMIGFTKIQQGFYAFYGKILSAFTKLLSNPFTAAVGALGIAAGLAALSRSLGGQARGVGGPSPSAFSPSPLPVTTTNSLSDNRGEATIVIQGGLLDMSDPRQADSLRRALSQLSGRNVVVVGG